MMLRENLRIFKELVYVADLCLVALAFQLGVLIESARLGVHLRMFSADNPFFPTILIWGLVLRYQPRCYVFRLRKTHEIIISLLKAEIIALSIFLTYIFFIGYIDESRLEILFFAIVSALLLIAFRLSIAILLNYYRSRGYNFQTVLVVGTGHEAKGFADKIFTHIHYGLKILGFLDLQERHDLWRYRDIPCIGQLDDLPAILKEKQVDFVVFAVRKSFLDKIEGALKVCEEMGARVSIIADFFPSKFVRPNVESFFGSPMICYDPAPGFSFSLMLKSFLDRLLAALGIIVTSPIMLVSAAAIKLNSPGPVIFKQPRCGLNGRKFTLYKFRSMIQNAEAMKKDLVKFNEVDGAAFKMKNDPRITKVGRFLRKTSLDELPQLFNILKGDMSFVGPRPPLADEVVRFDLWQRRKLSMKPGLTCLWQVSGRSNTSFEQWMKLDLEYIDNWSLWRDARILARTVPAVLKGTGAR
jgi:exopolysaccharide biosynthesis polyprenyl glycosylphosphotransferase